MDLLQSTFGPNILNCSEPAVIASYLVAVFHPISLVYAEMSHRQPVRKPERGAEARIIILFWCFLGRRSIPGLRAIIVSCVAGS
jgi:hypothetical protein